MSARQLFRLSGSSVVVGAVLGFLAILYSSLVFTGDFGTNTGKAGWVLVNLLEAVGVGLVLLGLPIVYSSFADRAGLFGLLGIALNFATGLMFGVFFSLFSAVLLPFIVEKAPNVLAQSGNGPPSLFAYFLVGSLASAVGPVLLAIPLLTRHLAPRWVGYVLIASGVFAAIGFVLPNSSTNVLLSLIGNLSPLLLLVGLGMLGYALAIGTEASPTLRSSPAG